MPSTLWNALQHRFRDEANQLGLLDGSVPGDGVVCLGGSDDGRFDEIHADLHTVSNREPEGPEVWTADQ